MHKYFIFLLFLLQFPLKAQIYIDFPQSGWVVQRDDSNHGKIQVQGRVFKNVENLEYRFLKQENNQIPAESWSKISFLEIGNTDQYLFNFLVELEAGSYRLELRGKQHTEEVVQKVEKIGIGEVFLIAGQSNAQGQANRGAANPTSNQVFCSFGNNYEFSEPQIYAENLMNYSQVFPTGQTAWCWGVLGDSLYNRLNVPIMFLNTAIGSTSSEDWALSAEEKNNFFPPNLGIQNYELKSKIPYFYLKQILKYYKNLTGFRAVLWHQGENDTLLGLEGKTTAYYENIKKVIQTSRNEINEEIAWVVSRVSYAFGFTDERVINAQNDLIKHISQVYAGPNTDTLANARADNLHFSNENNLNGLNRLGQVWNLALDANFFKNAKPILPIYHQIDVNCTKYDTIPNAKNFKNIGSYLISNDPITSIYLPFYFIKHELPNDFQIKLLTDSIYCETHQPKIYFNGNRNLLTYNWSNGSLNDTLVVTKEGTYFVAYKNKLCPIDDTQPTNQISISNFNLFKPKTAYFGKLSGCENDTIWLNYYGQNQIKWQDGSTLDSRKIATSGTYYLNEIHKNGCISAQSDVFTIERFPKPKPIVQLISLTDEIVALDSNTNIPIYEWQRDGVTLAFNTKKIPFEASGNYTVKSKFNYTNFSCYTKEVSQYFYLTPLGLPPYETEIQVFPNPIAATNSLQIKSSKPFDFQLVTQNGQLLLTGKNNQLLSSIELKNYPTGLYLLHIKTDNGSKSIKICIE